VTLWTSPRTWVTGALSSAALNTDVRDDLNYLYEVLHGTNADKIPFAAHDNNAWVVPQVHVALTSAWVLVNNAETAINFNSIERWDTNAIHDNAVNNTRLTPPTKGVYLCYAVLAFPANATGQRYVAIRGNGATTLARSQQPAASAAGAIVLTTMTVFQFNGATDYIEMLYFQDSGGSLTSPGAGNYSSEFGMIWLGGY
jgi:hypothetical protein